MNQRINQQVATCFHAEKLAIDHMCDPREWMPVPSVKSGERPGQSAERNAAIHHGVFCDIPKLIEIGEAMPDYLQINAKCGDRQTGGDEPECCNATDIEGFWGSSVACGKADSFSLLCCLPGHCGL